MLCVSENNRDEIEREFLALVLNKNNVLDYITIKPKYLKNKELAKILEYSIECYQKKKIVSPVEIVKLHDDFNTILYVDLFTNAFYNENAWKEQLKLAEESIIKYYKEDIIKNLNKKLEKGEISYDKFTSDIEKLKKIKINDEKNNDMLNINDIDLSKEEEKTYIKSKCFELDSKIKGFTLGQLSVWSGGNASAKSTYLNQIAIESIQQGFNTIIYSGELVAKRLLNWIVMQCAGKKNMEYNKSKEYYYVPERQKIMIKNWLNNKLFIYNNESGNKAKEIINSIKECVLRNNVKVVILDNLMSMDLSKYGDNKYDVQSEFIKDLSALAKKLDIHIHFVCHPRKVTNFLRKIDISGSADLTNIADNVFIMHRVNNDFRLKTKEMFKWNDNNPIYNYTNIIEVCKNRDYGVEDFFAGLYFEIESKRLLNELNEEKRYSWEVSYEQTKIL